MQERHSDRRRYFEELAETSRKYYVARVGEQVALGPGVRVLEIGCGDGGNLLPFAEVGCRCVGVDISKVRVEDARRFFAERGMAAEFLHEDVLLMPDLGVFDVVLCHDVYEHVADKPGLLRAFEHYLRPGGVAFLAFPAWQMPFGGHQQICHGRVVSHLPFIHLLPMWAYLGLLKAFGEGPDAVNELAAIKRTKAEPGRFERLVRERSLSIVRREYWLVNPHYEVKFGLRARLLPRVLAKVPYFRNFFISSCGYLLKKV